MTEHPTDAMKLCAHLDNCAWSAWDRCDSVAGEAFEEAAKTIRSLVDQLAAKPSTPYEIVEGDRVTINDGDIFPSTPIDDEGRIMLEIAAASYEQEMWERRFGVLCRTHPSWRSADNDGSWGLRDFLSYVGGVCGFDTRVILGKPNVS